MRKTTIAIFVLFISCTVYAQETITKTINHDGIERSYIIYIPELYDEEEQVPLVLNFHGFGSNSSEQMWYGDFRAIADTANFIVVHPQGSIHNGSTHWNVNGFIVNSPADDIGFVESLLEEVESDFSIDPKRIYSTGMSNGGFFSFLLSCQLSHKIAAIASVTGSMTPENYNNCDPKRPIPVMQIHGTSDPVVPYSGQVWAKSVTEVLEYWVDHNGCDQDPIISELPDVNATDGSTVTQFIYANGNNDSKVEHLLINGGMHTWPGSVISLGGTNQDISASGLIWKFFSQYDLDGKTTTSTDNSLANKSSVIYNPTAKTIIVNSPIQTKYQLVSTSGQIIKTGETKKEMDVVSLHNGIYFLVIDRNTFKVIIY